MVVYEKIQNDDNLPIKLLKIGGHVNGFEAVKKHWHNSIEIIYPHIFNCEGWIEGKNICIKENNVYIINSKQIHGFDEIPKGVSFHGYTLQINYDFIKSFYPQLDGYLFLQPTKKEQEQIKEYIVSIANEYENDSEFKYIKIQSYLLLLIYLLLNNLSYKQKAVYEDKSEKNRKRILKIVNYIDEHYQDDLSLECIADKFQLSQGHLTRIFNDNLNTSVMNYVSLQRLKKAKIKMFESDLPLVDIAIENGFSSLKSFTRLFKKEFGIVPSEYRKNINI